MHTQYQQAADYIKSRIQSQPTVGIILGSGLGGLATKIEAEATIPYAQIPNFPVSTVEGHSGQLIIGRYAGKTVVAMQGRFHFYEGYEMHQVTFPVRVMHYLGIKNLIVSNAAGGLNPEYLQGDLMIIRDHINFFPRNPLIGPNDPSLGTRFPDMSKVYNADLRQVALREAASAGIRVHEGIYIGSTGPTLETPAEYRMFHLLGADATGMSTVPEVIVAHHMGMRIFGISVITNSSTPSQPDGETTHDEVQDVAGQREPAMSQLVHAVIQAM